MPHNIPAPAPPPILLGVTAADRERKTLLRTYHRGKSAAVKYSTMLRCGLVANVIPHPHTKPREKRYCPESVKSNKEQCMRMVSQIDELLSAILHLCVKSDSAEDTLSPATLRNIGKFADTLQKIHSFIEAQQKNSKFRRFFRQNENTAQLEVCNAGLRHALDVFGVRNSLVATTELADIREQAEKRHEELVQLFTGKSEVVGSDAVSEISKSLFSLGNSTSSLVLIPASPKIFHGRNGELEQLVHLLIQNPARAAILGPGGIGKTSLATATLHHPDVSARYTNRHFVSCESVANREDLVSMIISSIGLEHSRNASKHLLRHFSQSPESILVLDNLETCWEPLESRNDVEEFLSLLTDITHLGLLITMRGAERPTKVRWTRPFMSPLAPLSDDAAMQTFTDITDYLDHDKHTIREILGLTDNLPLAINLVANIAAFEGHETVLSRWREEKTTLFSEGRDKRSNLDLSIQLSLSSPRMADSPGAHQLLSLLSLLPDGILETELLQCDLLIPDMGRSKTTLIRTSLAYLDHGKRLRVLVPIREYIQKYNPPSPALCRPLRRHFHDLILLWKDYQHLSSTGIAHRIAANVGNFQAVLAHGLNWNEPDLIQTLHSIMMFDSFFRISGRKSSGMLDLVPPYLERLDDHKLHGAYIIEFVTTWQYHPVPEPRTLEETALAHFRAIGDISGEARLFCVFGSYYRRHDNDIPKGLEYWETAQDLAKQVNDPKIQCIALREAAEALWQLGKYRKAQAMSGDLRQLARMHGLFIAEAQAIRIELLCRVSQGDLAPCLQLSAEARELLGFCGLQGGTLEQALLASDADVHFQKTEYIEARSLYSQTVTKEAPLAQAYDRLSMAGIEIETGVETNQIQQDLETTKSIFELIRNPPGITLCEVYLAYVDIREGLFVKAKLSLERSFALTRGNDQEISILCLNKLGDPTSQLSDIHTTFGWTLVLLAFAQTGGNSIAIYHALRCLGDIFLTQDDTGTALSLFQVAFDAFTAMDIHRSKGVCAVRMGDIFHRKGNEQKAVELWQMARPLFVRSSQFEDVAQIDKKIQDCSSIIINQ
ncbi:hypothetical protein C8R45DRAFT_1068855 [Mycena sanguinolenta]|nr:hypothetical protein C8R45DRAFT_1068855 [Mycena sanguinolenta]